MIARMSSVTSLVFHAGRMSHRPHVTQAECHTGRVSHRSSVTQVECHAGQSLTHVYVEENKDARVQHCRVASLGIEPYESDVEYLPSREGMVGPTRVSVIC